LIEPSQKIHPTNALRGAGTYPGPPSPRRFIRRGGREVFPQIRPRRPSSMSSVPTSLDVVKRRSLLGAARQATRARSRGDRTLPLDSGRGDARILPRWHTMKPSRASRRAESASWLDRLVRLPQRANKTSTEDQLHNASLTGQGKSARVEDRGGPVDFTQHAIVQIAELEVLVNAINIC
jgi:hypothetical protein